MGTGEFQFPVNCEDLQLEHTDILVGLDGFPVTTGAELGLLVPEVGLDATFDLGFHGYAVYCNTEANRGLAVLE